MKRLSVDFFERPTVKVAQELLGKILVRKIDNKIIQSRIIETEAYCGIRDLACHASRGLTERTKIMFGPAGFSYVYMIYGMYHCLNIVTEREGNPSAVLIRGVELANSEWRIGRDREKLFANNYLLRTNLHGPGKLCRELKIDRKFSGIDIIKSNLLWIEDDGTKIKKSQIKKGKRIGVDYAGKWKDKLWRFWVDN